MNAESGTSSNEPDPAGLTSLDDLADALRGLHRQSGELSLRDLERWARKQQQAGRADVRLTRTTVSEVLAGRRLPSRAFLSAFLEACGVSSDDAQTALYDARMIADRFGGVILHVVFGNRLRVEVLPRNVESIEAASRRAAAAR